jgi:hypothetical protein
MDSCESSSMVAPWEKAMLGCPGLRCEVGDTAAIAQESCLRQQFKEEGHGYVGYLAQLTRLKCKM